MTSGEVFDIRVEMKSKDKVLMIEYKYKGILQVYIYC